jgi:hypothetical protein
LTQSGVVVNNEIRPDIKISCLVQHVSFADLYILLEQRAYGSVDLSNCSPLSRLYTSYSTKTARLRTKNSIESRIRCTVVNIIMLAAASTTIKSLAYVLALGSSWSLRELPPSLLLLLSIAQELRG